MPNGVELNLGDTNSGGRELLLDVLREEPRGTRAGIGHTDVPVCSACTAIGTAALSVGAFSPQHLFCAWGGVVKHYNGWRFGVEGDPYPRPVGRRNGQAVAQAGAGRAVLPVQRQCDSQYARRGSCVIQSSISRTPNWPSHCQ